MRTKFFFAAVLLCVFLGASVFADNIYLSDGSVLVGKIIQFSEQTIEILLETGKSMIVSRSQVVRIDPIDQVTSAGPVGTTGIPMEYVQQPVAANMYGSSLLGQPEGLYVAAPVIEGPVGSLPDMVGDPEIEMRKRLLMYSEMKKEAWVAAELSLLIPSAGHLYVGEWERGFLFLGAKVAFGAVGLWGFSNKTVIDEETEEEIQVPNNATLGAVGLGGVALFALLEFVDAYYSAERYNQTLRLRLGIEQFDPMMLPTFTK
ncbi:MAG TPA: hypothetical protein PLF96_03160 [Thermotogota bacterium]|nr:hypothetical protein [Thermotogota bacterium]